MPIQDVLKEAVAASTPKMDDNFRRQIQENREFKERMDAAGVIPNKQEFSIPLIERIGTFSFSK